MQNPSTVSIAVSLAAIALLLWLLYRLGQWSKNRGGLTATIYEWDFGLKYVNGRFERELAPGRYFKWPFAGRQDIFTVRRMEQVEYSPPIDAVSKDGLVFRMSAAVSYRIVAPRRAYEEGHVEKLRLATNAAVVTLAAANNLQQLLGDRAAADAALKTLMGAQVCGCEITAAAIHGITLPPEIRRLFAEIERAKLEGLAALERARGENAALRALANAAGVLKGNPELMNLRILQAMATPSGKNQLTLVLGKDGLVSGAAG